MTGEKSGLSLDHLSLCRSGVEATLETQIGDGAAIVREASEAWPETCLIG